MISFFNAMLNRNSPDANGLSVFGVVADRMKHSGVLSIFDQAVVSGANFFTTLIIARSCTRDELGVYSLAWTVVLFLAAMQSNMITVPYTMYCHDRSGVALAKYSGSIFVHQLLASLVAMLCFLILDVVLSFGIGPESVRPAAWVLLGAIPFILLRDYARRFTFAHLALWTAVTIDIQVAVMQIGGLLALHYYGALSAATAYVAMGVACAAASLCWWLLDDQPMRLVRARIWIDWVRNWSFAKWALLSQLTGLAFYMLPWLLASVRGEAETGVLAACTALVGLSNLFVMGLNNFLMPKAARAFTEDGPHGLCRVLRKAMLSATIVLGSLCVFIFFTGDFLAHLVYGTKYADTGALLTVLAVATFMDALVMIASTGLWAMNRPAASLIGDFVQLALTLAVAFWLVFPLGAMGIAIAIVAGRMAGSFVRWFTLRMLMGIARCRPDMNHQDWQTVAEPT